MHVRAGHIIHDTRLGQLTLNRRLDPHQLELLVTAIEHAGGLTPRDIVAATLTEGDATFTPAPRS